MIQILQSLMYALPSLMRLINHYEQLSNDPSLKPEDKEKTKAILESLRWTPFDDL